MGRIEVVHGDITKHSVDAIVNAANHTLLGGGGVDGAIHRAGGKSILEECKKIGGCETGKAVITTAGKLPAKAVIHTVGPIWNGGDHREEEQLSNCYIHAIELAVKHALKTIALPNISTGVYRFPKKQAASIAIKTVKEQLKENDSIEKVIFVCFDMENYLLYKQILQ